MTIIDKPTLAKIRRLPCCWCGRRVPSEAAHLFAKGFGGGGQLDLAINTAPLCRDCHQSSHDGHRPITVDLLALVAQREKVGQDDIRAAIDFFRRVPNRPIAGQVEAELRSLRGEARRLVREILKQREAA